jgi:nicotinamide-nucleotide amidase
MAPPPHSVAAVELVSTGSELLSGRTVNRHAQVLGDRLSLIGLRLVRDTTVPDDRASIEEAVRSALRRVDLVVVSGGLGPTSDDVTRDALAAVFGARLVMDEGAHENIRARYARAGRAMNPSVERHALVLDCAAALPNSAGLAPGERIERDGKTVFLLPGPPREFLAVLTDHVIPWFSAHLKSVERPAVRLFEVCGLGESDIVTRLVPDGFPAPGVDVAYCAAPGRVEIRLSAPPTALDGLAASADSIRQKLGSHVFAEERVEMEEVIGRLLRDKKETVATAESCTGGLIGHRLTNVSGSSEYYLGGVVAYSNAAKIRDLGVISDALAAQGAVSAEVARQMAVGTRARFGADFGLSTTGIAGPTGGTSEKPVGLTYYAVADSAGCAVREHRFAGSRAVIKEWSSQMALDFLRRRLLGLGA